MKDEMSGGLLVLHIALGVFIGSLAAAWVEWRVTIWQAEQAAHEARAAIERGVAAAAARTREATESARRSESERRARAADVQAANENARRAADNESARRDAAWRSYYKSPPGCDAARGGEWTVECANDFMRAKKRFDSLYDEGKL